MSEEDHAEISTVPPSSRLDEEAQSDLEQNVSAGEESNHPAEDDAELDPTNPLDEDSVEAGSVVALHPSPQSLSRLDLAQNLTQEDVFGEDLSDSSDDEQGERRKRMGENGDGPQVERQSLGL